MNIVKEVNLQYAVILLQLYKLNLIYKFISKKVYLIFAR